MNLQRTTNLAHALIAALRQIDPTMPIQRAELFLAVALREGMLQSELKEELGLSAAAVSRNVDALTEGTTRGQPQLALLYSEVDLADERQRRLYLTPRGQRLIRHIHSIVLQNIPSAEG